MKTGCNDEFAHWLDGEIKTILKSQRDTQFTPCVEYVKNIWFPNDF